MADSEIRQLTEALNRNSYLHMQALKAGFRFEQLRQSLRTPNQWRAYYALVQAAQIGDAPILLNANPERSGLTLTNISTGTLLFSNEAFNVQEMRVRYKTPGGVIPIGVLAPNGNTSIPSSGALFAACATATVNCKVVMLETYYSVRVKKDAREAEHPWSSVEKDISHILSEFNHA